MEPRYKFHGNNPQLWGKEEKKKEGVNNNSIILWTFCPFYMREKIITQKRSNLQRSGVC